MRSNRSRIAGAVFALMFAVGPVPEARGASVLAGSDYFTTLGATFFDFGPGIGPVSLTGRFGPGVADTVVTRLEDAILPAVGDSDTIPIQMRLLELMSVAPVDIGGSFFDVFVSLDPAILSVGSMTINHEDADNGTPAREGTFTSLLTVNFIATFDPVLAGPNVTMPGSLALTSDATNWSHEPPPGAFLLVGLPGDLDANLHAPLPPGFNDFFVVIVLEEHPGAGIHEAGFATQICPGCPGVPPLAPLIPEPGTYLLSITGFALIALRRWQKKRNG